ncbi:MAG: MlaD family protein [Pseudomonadota bacterium]
METRAPYVFIGSVVLSIIAFAFLFILRASQAQTEFDTYDVVFEGVVSGLTVGGQVAFNGIQKGQVSKLTIDPDNPSIVVARVKVGKDTPIRRDTKAELELVGFTGVAIIQFSGGSGSEPLLKDTERGVPKIYAETGGIAQIFEGGNAIIKAANRLLSDENISAFSDILQNVDDFSTAFAEQDENVRTSIENLATVSQNIAELTTSLNAAADELEAVLGDDVPVTLTQTRKTIREAELLIADLRSVVEENRDSIAIFSEQGLAQTGPTLAEARRMFKTLEEVLRAIDRNPRGYLLGEATPQYEASQ